MKKILSIILVAIFAVGVLTACGKSGSGNGMTIGIPNDPTNESRALELLQSQGLITLKDTGDVEATVRDIVDNPYNISFKEIEAAQLPMQLESLDYAIINSNYAIDAGLTPFLTEGTDVAYPNIIAVKEGNENSDKTKALVAAVNSTSVANFIKSEYIGAVVCDLNNPIADGLDTKLDYAKLKGTTIKIAASPAPHADILKQAAKVLEGKGIKLDIIEFTDYIQPNMVVESGEVDANYFQHVPYLDDFNAENGTHIVSVLEVHHEPMGIYSNKYDSLDNIKTK